MRRLLPLIPSLAIAIAALSAAAEVDPAPVVAAERAFAADGLALGVQASFFKHSAPNGIVFAPEPMLAKAVYEAPQPKGPDLVWWPLWAGIARSGDLGFTTGPYTLGGDPKAWYFTVWNKQGDGSWKWLFDGGPATDPKNTAPQGSPVAYAKLSTRKAGSSAKAMTEVTRAETALAAAARKDVTGAYLAHLAQDGRVAGSRSPHTTDRAAVEAELATRPQRIVFAALGGQASAAGDLAWTYGNAAWTSAQGDERRGHYVRIWRFDDAGWRLLYDQLQPLPVKKAS